MHPYLSLPSLNFLSFVFPILPPLYQRTKPKRFDGNIATRKVISMCAQHHIIFITDAQTPRHPRVGAYKCNVYKVLKRQTDLHGLLLP